MSRCATQVLGRAAVEVDTVRATVRSRALLANTALSAPEIARKAMMIAGEICIYTNQNITVIETE